MDKVFLDNTLKSYILFLIPLLLGIIVAFSIQLLSSRRELIKSLKKGLIIFFINLGFTIGIQFLSKDTTLYYYCSLISKIVFIISITMFIVDVSIYLIAHLIYRKRKDEDEIITKQIISLLSKLIMITAYIISITMILNIIGVNVLSLVTGLGIGGLAIALAAQDLFSNILAGITIYSSKIIELGDYVEIDSLQGNVIYIGLRTTKIIMPNGRKIIMPNKKIVESTLINYSYGNKTLINYVIGLTYDTSLEKLKRAIDIIKDIIANDKRIADKTKISVGFYKFDNSSLNLYISFYVRKNSDIGGIKQDFHFNVKERFDKEDIDIAFPTQTVYLKTEKE